MARVIAYKATDMRSFDVWYGQVEEASEDRIVISDGAYSTTYRGEFYYNYDGDVFGVLNGIEEKLGRTALWAAWDINRNANTFYRYVEAGDTEAAKSFVLSGPDEIIGSSGGDVLQGYAGWDTISGGDGDDRLEGGWGADVLLGGAGRDVLDGGAGGDLMQGGALGDTYLVDDAYDAVVEEGGGYDRIFSVLSLRLPSLVEALTLVGDRPLTGVGNPLDNAIVGGAGSDRLWGLRGNDRLSGGDGNDGVLGGAGDDELFGNAGDDLLVGGTGNDVLHGGPGFDVLRAGAGDDTLYGDWGRDVFLGGAGADSMTGFSGNDVFRFLTVEEIGWGTSADTITDFGTGDLIDLRWVDADDFAPGLQSFQFIDDARFSGTPGELRFWAGRLMGDTNGDTLLDFALLLPATDQVTADQLLL